jgi:LexA-binding, inner membrane-associated putative hydrolase
MDLITHGLAGALEAQAGFAHRIGQTSTIAVVAGAMLPDVDVVMGLVDQLAVVPYHRGLTHSLGSALLLVFRPTLEAVGPERIIFGTDSSHFPRGLRQEILGEQVGILKALRVSKEDAQLILGGNISRHLRLNW